MTGQTIATTSPWRTTDVATAWQLPIDHRKDAGCIASFLIAVRIHQAVYVPYWLHAHRLMPREEHATNRIAVYILEQLGNDEDFAYATPPIQTGQVATPVYSSRWWSCSHKQAETAVLNVVTLMLHEPHSFNPHPLVSDVDWVLTFGANQVKYDSNSKPRLVVEHSNRH